MEQNMSCTNAKNENNKLIAIHLIMIFIIHIIHLSVERFQCKFLKFSNEMDQMTSYHKNHNHRSIKKCIFMH